ncbi:MAG: hypothetical protein ABI480_10145 [Chitinophagaceae bacterium]
MQLYTIDIKKYKTIYFQILVTNLAAIVGSFLLVKNGLYILSIFDPAKKLTLPILFLLLILSGFHTRYQRKQLTRLAGIADFDTRVGEYEKFYRFRMLWFLLSCLVTCFLCVLTGRYTFLFYAGFDVLISLPFYPGLLLFKKELKNEEIIFY